MVACEECCVIRKNSTQGESAIQDLFVLASCDYFVGTFSSHFGALGMFECVRMRDWARVGAQGRMRARVWCLF